MQSPPSPLSFHNHEGGFPQIPLSGLGTSHYHGVVNIHLHGPTRLYVHGSAPESGSPSLVAAHLAPPLRNIHRIPRKPVAASQNRRSGTPLPVATAQAIASPTPPAHCKCRRDLEKQAPEAKSKAKKDAYETEDPETWRLGKRVFHSIIPSAIAFLT